MHDQAAGAAEDYAAAERGKLQKTWIILE